MRVARWFLVVAVLSATSVWAQAQLPVYVSEQFKDVAQKAFRNIASEAIKNACPSTTNKALCDIVAERLALVFGDALRNDKSALKDDLAGLFFDTAAAIFVQISFDEFSQSKIEKRQALAISAIMASAVNAIAGRGPRAAQGRWADSVSAIKLVLSDSVYENPGHPLRCVEDSVASENTPEPADLVGVAADLAQAMGLIHARIALLQLEKLAQQGLTNGVTNAMVRYLSDIDEPGLLADIQWKCAAEGGRQMARADDNDSLVGFKKGTADHVLFSFETLYSDELSDCKVPQSQIDAIVAQRESEFWSYRERFLRMQAPELQLVTSILVWQCSPTARPESVAKLENFKRQIAYLVGPIEVQSYVQRYSTPALGVASIFDYVRTRDRDQLERGLRTALVFGVAQAASASLASQKMLGESIDAPKLNHADYQLIKASAVLRTCEARELAALLGVSLVDDSDCFPLAGGSKRTATAAPAVLPGKSELAQAGTRIQQLLATLIPSSAAEDLRRLNLAMIVKGVKDLASGRVSDGHNVVLRQGVDLIAAQLDSRVVALVGGNEKVCTTSVRVVSIFKGSDAACALHLLLKSAYQPIVDYFWAGDFEEQGAQQMATSVYKGLLASPGIDRSPLLLNFGLGASYVRGLSASPGYSPYVALTLLDKFGLAFLKYNGEKFRFETGVFVGGFLDALVRTAANSAPEQRNWLAGVTAGLTRICGLEFGIELHAAVAMPFELNKTNNYGIALGLAVVVPYTLMFSGE